MGDYGRQGESHAPKWADIVVLVAAVYVLAFAIWAPWAGEPNAAAGEARESNIWWLAQLLGGALPIAAYFVALKSRIVGKVSN